MSILRKPIDEIYLLRRGRTISQSVIPRQSGLSSFDVNDIRFNGVSATVSEKDEDVKSFEQDLECENCFQVFFL